MWIGLKSVRRDSFLLKSLVMFRFMVIIQMMIVSVQSFHFSHNRAFGVTRRGIRLAWELPIKSSCISCSQGQIKKHPDDTICARSFFSKFFRDLKMPSGDMFGSDVKSNLIIDNPELHMMHPYTGEEYIDEAIEQVRTNLMEPPSTREKAVLATIRGVCGGKTRFLEEIKSKLNTEDETLALTIKFNSYSTFDNIIIRDHDVDPSMTFAVEVIARVAAVFYRRPLKLFQKLLKKEEAFFC
jgi:hypothetical protein